MKNQSSQHLPNGWFFMYLKIWTFIWTKFIKNSNLRKYFKKLHFLWRKVNFSLLAKESPSIKVDFFSLSFTWTFRTSGTLIYCRFCLIRKYSRYSLNLTFGWKCNDTSSLNRRSSFSVHPCPLSYSGSQKISLLIFFLSNDTFNAKY